MLIDSDCRRHVSRRLTITSIVALIFGGSIPDLCIGEERESSPAPQIKQLAELTGHDRAPAMPRGLRAISLSADGRFVAYTPHWSGTGGRSPSLWDLQNARRIEQPVERQSQGSLHIAISPDGKWIGSEGLHQIHLWQTNAPSSPTKLIGTRGGTGFHMSGCCFSSDGKLFATSHPGKQLFVWDVASGREVHAFEGAGGLVEFATDGQAVAAASDELTIRVWSLERRGVPKQFKFDADVPRVMDVRLSSGRRRQVPTEIEALDYSGDGKQIAAVAGVRGLPFHWAVWDVETGDVSATRQLGRRSTAAAIVPGQKHVLLGDADGTIGLWDVVTGEQVAKADAHSGNVDGIAISADGKTIVTGGRDLKVLVFRLSDI